MLTVFSQFSCVFDFFAVDCARGADGRVAYDDLFCFDIATRVWTELTVTSSQLAPPRRNQPRMAAFNGRLYIFGGFSKFCFALDAVLFHVQ